MCPAYWNIRYSDFTLVTSSEFDFIFVSIGCKNENCFGSLLFFRNRFHHDVWLVCRSLNVYHVLDLAFIVDVLWEGFLAEFAVTFLPAVHWSWVSSFTFNFWFNPIFQAVKMHILATTFATAWITEKSIFSFINEFLHQADFADNRILFSLNLLLLNMNLFINILYLRLGVGGVSELSDLIFDSAKFHNITYIQFVPFLHI